MKKKIQNERLKEKWSSLKNKGHKAKKNRCLFLMLSLIVLLLSYQYVFVKPIVVMSLLSISLVSAVYAVSESKKHLAIATILGILVFISMFEDFVYPALSMTLMSNILLAGFYIFTLVNILTYVIRGQSVTKDKIYGALSIYMLIGFAWASLYRMVYMNDPSSFSGTPSTYAGIYHFDFIYYSFVSICSLGFGDIVPVSGLARSLTILEAMTGIMYMAVMISRLVSLYKIEKEE